MRKQFIYRVLVSILAVISMITGLLPRAVYAEGDTTGNMTGTWTPVALTDITADDTVAVTMAKDGTTWLLPTAAATSSGPAADLATVQDGTLYAQAAEYGWTIAAVEGGYTFTGPNGTVSLIADNNGVRVNQEAAAVLSVVDDHLTSVDPKGTTRYFGIYTSNPDWRSYTSINNNIKGQTLGFWKLTGEAEDPDPLTQTTIAEALAGQTGEEFMVKGVVTFVDGRNVYIQDETGGICLYPDAADASIKQGDTLIGTGKYKLYSGLPELIGAVIEKSEGMTLTAKETTLSALTKADICTYVSLKGLTVAAVSGTNIDLTDGTTTMQLYKAVLGDKVAEVGDTVDLKAAVGSYNKLQLRNMSADEITITKPSATGVAVPTATPAPGEVEKGTVVTFATETEGAVISYSTDNGATWTEGTTYTVEADVTLQVKAVLGEETSEIAEFVYTVKGTDPEDPYADFPANLNVYERIAKPENGDVVVIYNAGNTRGLKGEFSGYYLAGEELKAENNLIGSDAEKIEWTVTVNEDGTYTFKQGESILSGVISGTYKNPSLTEAANGYWNLTECNAENASWYVSNAILESTFAEEGGKIYLEWYANKTAFSLYDTSRISEQHFGMSFYKKVREATAEAPAEPTAAPAAGTVEAGTVVTFATETEGAVISYSTDNGATWTEGTTYTVNEDVTLSVKATKDGIDSKIVTFTYTVKNDQPVVKAFGKLTEAPADGAQIVIYHPTSKMVLTATASEKTLAGAEGTVAEDKLTISDEMAVLTVHTDGTNYTFELDGKYLTSGETGKSLTFAEDGTSDLAKWTLEQQTDGTWYLMNVGANYQGTYNQALEYYNGFTTYGVKADNTAYKFEFYGNVETEFEGLVTDLSVLKDGDTLVIYNESGNYAMSNTDVGVYYRGLETVTIENGLVVDPAETALWTLGIKTNDSGETVYTLTAQDGRVLSAGTRNSLPMNDENQEWTITPATTADSFYIINAGRPTQYVEYYASKSEFSAYRYSEADEAVYAMKLYKYVKSGGDEPEEPGKTYGLVSTLATGDKVIIYNSAFAKGVSSVMIGSYYLSGADLTPESGIITTNDENVVWDVTVNEDGTYTFTQGEKTFGGVQSTNASSGKVYNNISLTVPTATKWTAEAANNGVYLYLGELPSSKDGGHIYLDWYDKYTEYSLNDYANPGTDAAYIFTFYKEGAEPEVPVEPDGDLVRDLSQLKDGATVAIYSPGHKTAISSKPNGDWYLKARSASVKDNKVEEFTEDMIWSVKVNDNGTYSFYGYTDGAVNMDRSIAVWPSGDYAELTVNVGTYPDNTWTLTPAKTANCFYANSPTVSGSRGAAYIEAYVRNESEVFSGYFTSPSNSRFTENEFALQFYLINPEDAVPPYDDGVWDGVLNKDEEYIIYNANAQSAIGLFAEANYSMRAIPSEPAGGNTIRAGNGAYVFKVDTMGRYYSFETNGKYLASNDAEELLFVTKDADGKLPETAKWYLVPKESGYIIYNKEASYNGTPVCIEYYSSVFSGWTFSTKNDVNIYLFNFYKPVEDTKIYDGVVQDPRILFNGETSRYIEQDYKLEVSLDDLAPEIENLKIEYKAGSKSGEITDYEGTDRAFSFTIPADAIDSEEKPDQLIITVTVKNSYGIEYVGPWTVDILDEPFFQNMTPAPNSQTGDDKKPVISVETGNVGDAPEFTMTLNDEEVTPEFKDGVLTYTPAKDLKDGRTNVKVTVKRADGKTAEKTWTFIVGKSEYQLYFGQLHSHTTYSDGSGSLDTALEYIKALPESANVQFVAFTDHSNYFDTTSAANPADAMNDKSLMTDASRAIWEEYKDKVAKFNETNGSNILAIAGFEMTWSGGPGHINSFNTDGLVSRNNAALNNKSGDAGMKLYYETMNKDNGETMHQFNHPGSTFGNFTDFSYWDEETDKRMFLVEVGNGEGQIGAGGYYPSYEQYIMALDKGWHVGPTNNQDNHKGRWGNANDARDVILTNDFTEEGIYDAIRARRIYATEDKNLQIYYTMNGQQMGSILSEEEAPETLNIDVTLYDPDNSDSVAKVEVVADGGTTVHTWENAEELAEGHLTVELEPEYSYYFIRVTQKDGDLAVTAPVWAAKASQVGIKNVTNTPEIGIVNEDMTLTTTLFNNEDKAVSVKSLTFTTNGSVVIGTDTTGYTINAGSTLDVPFTFKPDTAKRWTVTVSAVVEIDGKEMTYTKDIEFSVRAEEGPLPVTPIAKVQAQKEAGFEYAIEGIVVSNASGYDKDTAFFDCIYVEDETGGICCFPVSGNYKIGDKVHIEGYTDFYQGEAELQVTSIEVIGEGSTEPKEVTAAQINDQSVLGSLVTLKGTVESFELENGLIQTIMVKDANGDIARVFIDGYITTGKEVENCEVGAEISATGLASYDNTWKDTNYFPRIRIRNRADIICTTAPQEDVAVTGITLDPTEVTLNVEETAEVKAVIAPENATNKAVRWMISNPKIASVDENGVVTGIADGTTWLIASTVDGGYIALCKVTVSAGEEVVAVTGITLDPEEVTVVEGETAEIKAVITPDNATNKAVRWNITNPGIASVDENGVVTGIAEGTTWLIASTVDSGYVAFAKVTVKASHIPVTAITLNKTETTIRVGKTETLTATVTPENASDPTITWSSSDTSVATVDANGVVTGVADKGIADASEAVITASAENGTVIAECKVYVEDPINAFVRRLYKLCLNRGADPSGFKTWTTGLKTKKNTAALTVRGFFLSQEMANLKLSNEEYVERCYLVMMDRPSDSGGKKYWVDKLKAGTSRYDVLKGFVHSTEFTNICNSFGIERGTLK